MTGRRRLVLLLLALVLPAQAIAQGTGIIRIEPAPGGLSEPTPPAMPGPRPGDPAPYDTPMLRLAEILGSLHYLRQLCKSGEGALWRDQMQGLIDAEAPDDIRKARLIDRFNRGYESYRAVYRTCTATATTAIDRYVAEGAKIASDITARFGSER